MTAFATCLCFLYIYIYLAVGGIAVDYMERYNVHFDLANFYTGCNDQRLNLYAFPPAKLLMFNDTY